MKVYLETYLDVKLKIEYHLRCFLVKVDFACVACEKWGVEGDRERG